MEINEQSNLTVHIGKTKRTNEEWFLQNHPREDLEAIHNLLIEYYNLPGADHN